jgi:hypothetical protein
MWPPGQGASKINVSSARSLGHNLELDPAKIAHIDASTFQAPIGELAEAMAQLV